MGDTAKITHEDLYAEILHLRDQVASCHEGLDNMSRSLDAIEGHVHQTYVGLIGINNSLSRLDGRFDSIEAKLDRIEYKTRSGKDI